MNSTHIFKPEILIKSFSDSFYQKKRNPDMFNSNSVNLFFFSLQNVLWKNLENFSKEEKRSLFWIFFCISFDLLEKFRDVGEINVKSFVEVYLKISRFFFISWFHLIFLPLATVNISSCFFLFHYITLKQTLFSPHPSTFTQHLITFHSTIQEREDFSFQLFFKFQHFCASSKAMPACKWQDTLYRDIYD